MSEKLFREIVANLEKRRSKAFDNEVCFRIDHYASMTLTEVSEAIKDALEPMAREEEERPSPGPDDGRLLFVSKLYHEGRQVCIALGIKCEFFIQTSDYTGICSYSEERLRNTYREEPVFYPGKKCPLRDNNKE